MSLIVVRDTDLAITKTVCRLPGANPEDLPGIIALVQEDLQQRQDYGMKKYGVELKAFDLNDPLREAYQEALDQLVYLRQAIYERQLGNPTYIAPWFLVYRMLQSYEAGVSSDVWDEARAWLETTIPRSIREPLGI